METPRFGNGPAWESDPHFRIATHPSRILIWTSDTQGYVDYVNPQWSALTGIHSVSLLGFGWQAAIDPIDLPALRETMRHAATDRAAFRERLRIRRHDGGTLWMVVDGQPRINELGTHVGYLVTCLDVTPHSEAELEIDLSEERLIDLIRESQLPGVALDVESNVIFSNESFCRLVGRKTTDLTYQKFGTAIGVGERAAVCERIYPQGRQRADFPHSFETTLVRGDRARRTVRWHALVMRHFGGQAKGVVLIGEDVTQEIEAEQKLLLTQRVFETTDQAMVITDAGRNILSVNQAFTELTGYSAGEAIGQNPRLLQSGRHDAAFYAAMWNSIGSTGHWQGDIWDRRKDGSLYPKFLSISAIRNEHGEVTNYSGVFHDISERKAIEDELDRLVHIDHLTGLANLARLFDQGEAAISLARRTGSKVGLIVVDLDNFKTINDTIGHAGGDELLKRIAERLRACTRRHDTAARLSGDRFALLLPEIAVDDEAMHTARKVLGELARPIDVAGTDRSIAASVGVGLFPDDAENIATLHLFAEQAMREAKSAGGARVAANPRSPPEP